MSIEKAKLVFDHRKKSRHQIVGLRNSLNSTAHELQNASGKSMSANESQIDKLPSDFSSVFEEASGLLSSVESCRGKISNLEFEISEAKKRQANLIKFGIAAAILVVVLLGFVF